MQWKKQLWLALMVLILVPGYSINAKAESPKLVAFTQSIPNFKLPTLFSSWENFTQNDVTGCASLINIWASWCKTCKQEHSILLMINKDYKIPIYGINAQDTPENAKAYLAKMGNPYKIIGIDTSGDTALSFGVTAVPETFLIGQNGEILYHQPGAMDKQLWEKKMWPLILSRCK